MIRSKVFAQWPLTLVPVLAIAFQSTASADTLIPNLVGGNLVVMRGGDSSHDNTLNTGAFISGDPTASPSQLPDARGGATELRLPGR
jgi:hypothetical protein